MMKIDCNVIKDLLPLYVDDAASAETKELVESHIAVCPDCMAELEAMKKDMPLPVCGDMEMEKAGFLAAVRKQLRRKKAKVATASASLAILLVAGIYVLMVFPTRVIPYEEGLVEITAEGQDVLLQFKGKSYDCVYMLEVLELEIDGEKKYAAAIYYDENLYSRYLEPLIRPDDIYRDHIILNDPYAVDNYSGDTETVQPPVDVVYYSSVKLNRRYHPELHWPDYIDEMQIIWQR